MALDRLERNVHEIVSFVAAVLGLACMATFLFLIDYAARLLRPVSILARVGNEGLVVIESVYPNEAGEAPDVVATRGPCQMRHAGSFDMAALQKSCWLSISRPWCARLAARTA